jgi:hypothetical protein
MAAPEEPGSTGYSVKQIAEAREKVVDLLKERDRLRAALVEIEGGLPAGSRESSLATDGTWRSFARELQRVARVALKGV